MRQNPLHNDQKRALVIGGSNMDISASGNGPINMHDSNPGHIRANPGGVGRNIAENLARLGLRTSLISIVGNDLYGNQIIEKGTEAGINMDNVMKLDHMSTSTYISILDDLGDMLVAVSDMEIVDMINLVPHSELIKNAPIIIADTNLKESTLDEMMKAIEDQPLFIDTVSTAKAVKIIPYLDKIHTLKANYSEALILSSNETNIDKVAASLHQKGVKRIFITLGADGVFYSDGETSGTLKKEASNIINTNGAGDAFTSALAFSWFQDWDLINTVQFSICSAELALSHADTINPEMLLDVVLRIKEKEYGA
jgi:pseudouridine kinase